MPKAMANSLDWGSRKAMLALKNAGELKRLVEQRTGFRIRDVLVELDRDHVVLRGQTPSFHVKQLAQEGIIDVMPGIRLVNAIEVRN
jgi:hypothetical protein